MHIKVKGVSGHLVFVLDDSQEFNNLIKELESLLDSPLFKSNGFYPKAFFDFKSRILSVRELTWLLDLLFEKQVLLFDGINMIKIVRFSGKLYVMGRVSGFVEGMTPNSRISGQCFKNAHIRINGVSRQSYTSFELTMLYYKDSEIFLDKGDMIYV